MNYFMELLEDGVPEKIEPEGFTFEDCFDEYIAGDQKVWSHDRSTTVGASEAFGCIRKTYFGKNNYPVDPDYDEDWGAMRRGDLIENYHVVPAMESGLRRRGMELILAGEGQNTIVKGKTSATLDGLIIPVDGGKLPKDFLAYYGVPELDADSVVFEIKSIDPRLFDSMMHEKSVHHGQAQIQMGLIRETTDYKPDYAVIIYVNASWLSQMRVFIVEFNEDTFNTAKERNDLVFSTTNPELLPAEGKLDGDCKYCKFTEACAAVSKARVPPAKPTLTKAQLSEQDAQALEEMEELVQRRKQIKEAVGLAERELEETNEAIRLKLSEMNESRMADPEGMWKVNYTYQAGARRLSKTAMIEDGIDPEKYMVQGAGFEKLTVTTK